MKRCKQTLESEQYGLELSFKSDESRSDMRFSLYVVHLSLRTEIFLPIRSREITYPYLGKMHETTELGSAQENL